MTILNMVRRPADLRRLDRGDLEQLGRFLIDAVCRSGGHLGPNLGVVELTIALHRVFDSPQDPIVWDTEHQSYVHKLLTGRQDDFARLRRSGGLSGYPSRKESAHDLAENSHASTALSYADGLAKAFRLRGEHDRVPVAVIGDGAMTGGMAWEALNNIGIAGDRPLVIVLNDNARSYARTIGGFAEHLERRRSGNARGSLFAELGIFCTGPVDGHDLTALEEALGKARVLALKLGGPVLIHGVTVKGKGYLPAESDAADCLHAVGVVDPSTGKARASGAPTWTSTFADEIVTAAGERPDIVAITAAMLRPVGLQRFAAAYPERVFDVGIAEQHAVTSAAGLAMGGMHPVVAVYATFINRAFDQALMDVALHRLPVTFVLDRAGVTGEDGASHHGIWDMSLLNLVPGLRIAAPRDASMLRAQLREAVSDDTAPTLLRFPKGGVPPDIPAEKRVGGVDVLLNSETEDVLLVAVGSMAGVGLAIAERLATHGIGVTVVDPCWVKPVDPVLVRLAATHRMVVTVEDNLVVGGVGSAIAQQIGDVPVRNFGIPQRFLAQGTRAEILAECGLTAQDVAREVVAEFVSLEPIEEVSGDHGPPAMPPPVLSQRRKWGAARGACPSHDGADDLPAIAEKSQIPVIATSKIDRAADGRTALGAHDAGWKVRQNPDECLYLRRERARMPQIRQSPSLPKRAEALGARPGCGLIALIVVGDKIRRAAN
ncbi:1-deoxy-D-xylulose-5-phosphate synthase 1 [Lentzea flava]|uniref:1-deoxy-D-xylulose-5-phosphate synthase n=1 Tax=Lentzea flava TaxID=103732 RepID=A0ABQ2VGU6_9PSEU|nr:1-deoxy-D-xylulose-5-phosphate synthase [Lentzea flava]GGU86341.1 1-deoxy-D-xylulose-5-phosphate synthase 1 [Lentzea flava]